MVNNITDAINQARQAVEQAQKAMNDALANHGIDNTAA